ncbi:MAG: GHKL domain-containing protein [Clostridia bacterium]|nr:GHKL domain-containing protein [Clostridia bacterium]
MENILIFISNVVIQTFMCAYPLYGISKLLKKEEYSKKQIIWLCIISVITVTIILLIKQVSKIASMFTSIVALFLIAHYILKNTWLKSLLIAILVIIYNGITETLCFFIGMTLLKKEVVEIATQPLSLIALSMLQCILSFIILELIHFIINKKANISYMFENVSYRQILVFIGALTLCIFPQLIIFVLTAYSYPAIFLIVNSLQFIIICIFLFVYLKKSVEHEKTQSDLFTSELHNKTLVGMVDGVRTLKHDYNNIMQALNGYVSTKQYDKIQTHINGVLDECNIVNNLAVIDPSIFNDPAIYGIVGSKFFLANEQNLQFDFDIVTNIAEIQFPMPDLSRILGILLDNAMEATKKCSNPFMRLEMKYDKRKCADIIRVVNTYDTSIHIDLDEIYKKGFSTKQVKSGIGLWEVKKLVSKVKNAQIYATIERDKFVQNIIIEKVD